METRIIRTRIYRDKVFRKLSDKEKFIVIFLLTNEFLEALPAVEVDLEVLAFHASTTEDYLTKLLSKLTYFQVFYVDGFLIVGDLFTYSNYKGGKTQSKKLELYNRLPDNTREYVDIEGNIAQSLLNHCSIIEHINHKTKNIKHKTEIINSEIEKSFEEFWKLYPRKVEKQKAKEKYLILVGKDKIDTSIILDGLNRQLPIMQKQEDRFIPHPTTWLNGRRWEDELPKVKKQFEHQREAVELF